MRKDKEIAYKLRAEGNSYRKIQDVLGVSRGTLTVWFRTVPSSQEVTQVNKNTRRVVTQEQMKQLNLARMNKLDKLYAQTEATAEAEYQQFRNEPLFWAGLMAYAGDGDTKTRHLIRLSNKEFYIHKVFIRFSVKYLGISLESLRLGLILSPEQNESLCKEMWTNILSIPRLNFYKTQVIQWKNPGNILQYGVGMSIIPSTVLKKKLIKWLQLAQDERFELLN